MNIRRRANFAESIMEDGTLGKSLGKDSAMTTYVAAGIAIQCAGTSIPNWPNDWRNSGIGPAQVSWNQRTTACGKEFEDVTIIQSLRGKEAELRGYGLRRSSDPNPGTIDPKTAFWAREYMRRRIQLVWDKCKNCQATDYYIAAALAQNGPGFSHVNMAGLRNATDDDKTNYGTKKDWRFYFGNDADDGNMVNTKTQLDRFTLIITELKSRGWYVPQINENTISILRNWREKE